MKRVFLLFFVTPEQIAQQTFTCSKSTVETEKGVKYVQS